MWLSAHAKSEAGYHDEDDDDADEDIDQSDYDEGDDGNGQVREDGEVIQGEEAGEDEEPIEEGESNEDDDTGIREDSATDSDSDLEYAGKHGISGLLKVRYLFCIVCHMITVLYCNRNGSVKWPRTSSAMTKMSSMLVQRKQQLLVAHARRYVSLARCDLCRFSWNM